MPKFRHRPTEVEAWQFDPTVEREAWPQWMQDARIGQFFRPGQREADHLAVHTLEGVFKADPESWIIRGTAGEVYVCARDLFANLYEPVELSATAIVAQMFDSTTNHARRIFGAGWDAAVKWFHANDCDLSQEGLCEVADAGKAWEEFSQREGFRCTVPPPGWKCRRAPGHEGPCAATEDV